MNSSFCTSQELWELTPDRWTLQGDNQTLGRIFASFLLLFELIGLPWNILVVVTIVKEKLYNQPAVILLLNLLVADFFILLIPTPLFMTTGFSGEFILGSSDMERCKFCRLSFVIVVPVYNSMFTVALMSLDRFFYIYKPFKYERNKTKYATVVAVIICVVCSIIIGIVSFVLSTGDVYLHPLLMLCVGMNSDPKVWIKNIILIVVLAISLGVIIISNVSFSCIVFKNIRAVYSHDGVTDKTSKDYSNKKKACRCRLLKKAKSSRHQKQRRLCRMQFALLVTSIITLVPMILILVGILLSDQPDMMASDKSYIVTFMLIIHYSQVICNPILETFLITDIRYPMKNMLTCGMSRRKNDPFFDHSCDSCMRTSCIDPQGRCSFWLAMFEAGHVSFEPSTASTSSIKKSNDSEAVL